MNPLQVIAQWLFLIFVMLPITIPFYTGAVILSLCRIWQPNPWTPLNLITGIAFWIVLVITVTYLWYHLSITMSLGWS